MKKNFINEPLHARNYEHNSFQTSGLLIAICKFSFADKKSSVLQTIFTKHKAFKFILRVAFTLKLPTEKFSNFQERSLQIGFSTTIPTYIIDLHFNLFKIARGLIA